MIGLASRLKLTVPVLDKKNYKGVITTNDLIRYIAGSHDQPGGIIVIEVVDRDYSLRRYSDC